MVRVKFELPAFSVPDAERVARVSFGLTARAHPLPSERDQNFYLAAADGQAYVLKIANTVEDPSVLDMQNQALEYLARTAPSLALPRLCLTPSGQSIVQFTSAIGQSHFVRLLTYVPGRLW